METNQAGFTCQSHITLEWKFYDLYSNSFELYFESANHENDIIIPDVSKEDEGNYECTGLTHDMVKFLAFGKLFVRGMM